MESTSRLDGQQKKPSKFWTIFAWVVVVFFALAALVALSSGSVSSRIGGLLISLAFALPAAWMLYCRSRDKKAQATYAASVGNGELSGGYPGATQEMAALTPLERKPRKWGWVAGIAVVVGLIGVMISPAPEPSEVRPAAEETLAPVTTTSATPNREAEEERKAEESAAKESRAKESEERAAKESESRAAEASKRAAEESAKQKAEEEARAEATRKEEEAREREAQAEREKAAQEQAERDRIAREEAAAAAERERIRNEQQQQQQQQFVPAPAPAPAASYKNCTDVWNRLGRPITPSDPGYTSGPRKLDGNSDGVGCESDPR